MLSLGQEIGLMIENMFLVGVCNEISDEVCVVVYVSTLYAALLISVYE
jgi:hypothetical protein